jgi:hypothetical protein
MLSTLEARKAALTIASADPPLPTMHPSLTLGFVDDRKSLPKTVS